MPAERKVLAAAWLGLLCGLAAIAGVEHRNGWHLRADILTLLPASQQQPAVQQATQRMAQSFEQQLLLVVPPPATPATFEQTLEIARLLERQMQSSGLFEQEAPASWDATTWQQHRYQLVDTDTLEKIARDPSALLKETEAALFGLATGPVDLEHDPLGLHQRTLREFLPDNVEPLSERAFLTGTGTLFITARLRASAFDAGHAQALLHWMADMKRWANGEGRTLLASGLPLFAANGAVQAQREISLFGSLSLAGVVLLLLFTFSSPRPLLATLTCIGIGTAAGFLLTHAVFGYVHMLTLVFGVSLIGISVDYALHYLCAEGGIADVGRGITLAMLSSVAAFASFFATPFPGLQQIAAFSGAGLVAAWLTVAGLLPLVRLPGPGDLGQRAMRALSGRGDHRLRHPWPVAAVTALALLSGIAMLQPNDDVRVLQSVDPALAEDDAQARLHLPEQRASQFFLVEAADPAELARIEQSLSERLEGLGVAHRALVHAYPTEAQQAASHRTLQAAYYDSGALADWYLGLGMDDSLVAANAEAFGAAATVLSLPAWAEAAPPPWRDLWLGCDATACRSIVTLASVPDPGTLTRLDVPGATWVDRVEEISSLLARYRTLATEALGVVYLVLGAAFLALFGLRGGLRVLSVPALSVLTALAASGLLGLPFTLFSVLALMVVVGISLDYGIFYHLHGRQRPATALAISLSALTTVLAFGMLSFSSTAVVETFGKTLFFGITAAWLAAPLAGQPIRSSNP